MNRDIIEWILVVMVAPAAAYLLLAPHMPENARGMWMGVCFAAGMAVQVIRMM